MHAFQRLRLGDGAPAVLIQDEAGRRVLTCAVRFETKDGVRSPSGRMEIIEEGVEFHGGMDSFCSTSVEYHEAYGLSFLRGEAQPLSSAILCGEWTGGKWLVEDLTEACLAVSIEDLRRCAVDAAFAQSLGWREYDFSAPGAEGVLESVRAEYFPNAHLDARSAFCGYFGVPPAELDGRTLEAHRLLAERVRAPLPKAPKSPLHPHGDREEFALLATIAGEEDSHTRMVRVFADEKDAKIWRKKAEAAEENLRRRYGTRGHDGMIRPTGANPWDLGADDPCFYDVRPVPRAKSGPDAPTPAAAVSLLEILEAALASGSFENAAESCAGDGVSALMKIAEDGGYDSIRRFPVLWERFRLSWPLD